MNNSIKRCQVDTLLNDFLYLYQKYKFLCLFDELIYGFYDDDFETFSINFIFYLKSLDSEFKSIIDEFDNILNSD